MVMKHDFFSLIEEHKLPLFGNILCTKIFGSERDEVSEKFRILCKYSGRK
jgi:hypothetical protein